MSSTGDPTEPRLVLVPSSKPPFPPPSLFDLAQFVDTQAEELKKLCEQLSTAFVACSETMDPLLDEQELFDPVAARFLWNHVPDLTDIASRVSVLGFWLQLLRHVIDVERQRAAGG